ncbi:uncharacterized protein LOC121738380 [Aricia agestis]|uniref:uncharacterized protein LOC121738380 n=1 Tax=Aricia agestis TaxID=91739 RepID=UPI001C2017F8|nr:uncharacterized protein LOC121738380 [Aricia agestis]
MATLRFLFSLYLLHTVIAKGSEPQIQCTPEYMKVTVPMEEGRDVAQIYLDQLKDYTPCEPIVQDGAATFLLDLQDYHKCAVTRILHKLTGKKTYYHKIVIEDSQGGRDTLTVRCKMAGKRVTRQAGEPFPLDFNEPDVLNITRYVEEHAPELVIGAVVKQNGKQVSGEISVSPGTPLMMEIFLNEESAKVYGLLVNYMHVTDTGKQQETIVFNGCSVDPYLFDNFMTVDGRNLTAKFRAFKFPDTTYVQFKGTVTVCLDKCQGVQCTNGATAYGRRRRAVVSGADANNLYEVSLTTIIKVDWADGERREAEEVLEMFKNLKVANQMLGDMDGTPATVAEQTGNTLIIHAEEVVNSAHTLAVSCATLLVGLVLALYK